MFPSPWRGRVLLDACRDRGLLLSFLLDLVVTVVLLLDLVVVDVCELVYYEKWIWGECCRGYKMSC